MASRAVLAGGLALGWLADQVLGDPRRRHPVAGFGTAAAALEDRIYADGISRGVWFTTIMVGSTAAVGCAIQRLVRDRPVLGVLTTATATWAVLGGRSLLKESEAIASTLGSHDLHEARARIAHLVSRDPASLDEPGIARAALESVAENTSDAVVAPLVWGAVAGIPGLLAYRAVNTLDAMVGYRSRRYCRFGWASARLDDIANLIPARLTALLTVAAAPLVSGSAGDGLRAIREHSGRHPSPNGGRIEAAFAGVLGLRFGGRNTYDGVEEDRGELGFGRPPRPGDLARANRLASAVSVASLAVSIGVSALLRRVGTR
ncbi:MAG: cobalamin biosynthesis protein [Arachnia sp.]